VKIFSGRLFFEIDWGDTERNNPLSRLVALGQAGPKKKVLHPEPHRLEE